MADPSERIEAALARIEAAATARAFQTERLVQRNARLRDRVRDAVEALDAVIARESAGAE